MEITSYRSRGAQPSTKSSQKLSSISDLSLPQLITPEEAARYLGISPHTVRRRLSEGELPGRKHGAKWLIRVVDLEAYVTPNNRVA